jgi:phosphoglucomutase
MEAMMATHPLAGKPAPRELLVNVPRLVSAYYTGRPDPSVPEQQVAFGTSGHRGSSLLTSFNEDHILAICQALCEWRHAQHIDGPLYIGMDTHALSEPALATAVEVFAANQMEIFIQAGLGYTPTPVISHAILTYNRGRASGLADGVVITPSHNHRTTHPTMAASSTTHLLAARPIRRPPSTSRIAPTSCWSADRRTCDVCR